MGVLNLRTMDKIFTKLANGLLHNRGMVNRLFALLNLVFLPFFLLQADAGEALDRGEEHAVLMPSRSTAIMHRSFPELELEMQALAAAVVVDDENLLQNPSFEDDLDDWQVSGYAATADNRYVQDGDYYVYLWYNGGSTTMYQEIDNIIPGETYDLTWYGGTHNSGFNHEVGLSFYDAGGSQIGSTVWQQVNYVVGCCDFGTNYPMALYNLDGIDDNNLNEEGISLVAPTGAFTVRVSARNTGGDYLKLDAMCLDGPVCVYPSTTDDSYQVCDNVSLNENVGDNDSDLGSTTFTITVDPANGTASIDDDGNLTYTADGGFTGTDNLTYEVCNDGVCCATGQVQIEVFAASVLECESNINDEGWVTEADCEVDVCEGDKVLLSVNPNVSTVDWTGPNGFSASGNDITVSETITTSEDGDYVATLTDGNGCVSTATITVNVSATPVLECESNINDQGWVTEVDCTVEVCEGDKVLLSVNPNVSTVEWTGPNGVRRQWE